MPLSPNLFGVVCPLGFRAIMRRDNWPGLVLSLLAATMALLVARVAPAVSPLLVAIVLGILATNIRPLPDRLSPGLAVASKRLLRMGIVLLGLQLVLADIAALGVRMVVAVALIVAFGFAGTLMAGRALGVPPMQRLLVAAGFSICGAVAVAAVDAVVEADEEDVASAIALVVLFGTAMIALGPALTGLLDLSTRRQGLVIGGAVHEVAQVVAAGGIIGHAALAAAVTVKLARVAMLAPMIMVIGAHRRHRLAAAATTSNPPLVPLFVAGFLAAAVVRTAVPLDDGVISAARMLQTVLLAAAMFALGTGVKASVLRKLGGRPLALGALSTAWLFVLAVGAVAITT